MKKTTNKFYQRVLALMLALMLCVGMMPMAAFATEGENEPAPEVTQSEPAPVESDSPVTDPVAEPETSDPAPETSDEGEDTSNQGTEDGIPSENTPEQETPSVDNTPAEESKPEEPAEDVEPEEPVVETVPAEVQAFLDAVAAIPAITPENAAEVAEYVYGPVSEAYEALLGTEYEEREDVQTAVIAYAAAINAVDAAMEMESVIYASLAQNINAGTVTKYVGEDGSYQRLPRLTLLCPRCGGVALEYIPDDTAYSDTVEYDDDIVKNLTAFIGEFRGNDYGNSYKGLPCYELTYTARKPGTTPINIRLDYYYDAKAEIGYCDWCGQGIEFAGNYNDYYDLITFNVNVYAYYTVNFLPGGDNVTNMPSSVSNSKQFTDSYTVTTQQPSREGYTFTGWVDDKGNNVGTSAVAKWYEGDGAYVTRTLTATWEEDKPTPSPDTIKYTVVREYYINGEKIAGVKSGDKDGTVGQEIVGKELADASPKWANYTVDGEKLTFSYTGCTPDPKLVLTANAANNVITLRYDRQTPTTYTVVHEYYTNGQRDGSTQSAAIKGTVGQTVKVEDITKVYTYTKNGVENTYAYTRANKGNAADNPDGYDLGEVITALTLAESSNIIVLRYDRATTATYTVQWLDADHNGAELKRETRTGKVGDTVSVTPADKNYGSLAYAGDNYPGTVLSAEVKADGSTVLKMYFKQDVPEEPAPEPPTADEVNKELKDPEKAGSVNVVCEPKRHAISNFDTRGDRISIGEVVKGANGVYTCDVTFNAQVYCDAYNALKLTVTNPSANAGQHTLVKGQTDKTFTFTWNTNSKKWTTTTAGPVVFYVECPEIKNPLIVVDKSHSNLHTDPETGNVIVDYTVNVTNESGFTIYGLKLTDNLNLKLTGEGADATYTFRDWKVNGGEPLAVSSGANGLFHEIGMLDRNVEFADQQPVTLTYTVEIAPNSATKTVKLHNDATAYSWSKKYYTAARAFFMAARGLDDLYPDNPDISGGASDTTGDDEVSGSDSDDTEEIVIPTKYTVYYDWGTLPEGVTATLPTGKTGPEGSHFTVDTNYTSETTIKVGDKTYKFSGWTVPGDIETEEAEGQYKGQYVMPDHDVEITGSWTEKVEPVTYTVTYTDGVDDQVVFEDQSYPNLKAGDNTPAFNGTPSREGYTFAGWSPAVAATVTGNATYVAQWTPVETVTVTWLPGYGTNAAIKVKPDHVKGAPVPSSDYPADPSRSGYRFTGWGAPVTDTVTGNITITAQWRYITPGPDPDPDPTHTPTPTPTPDPTPTPTPEPTDDPTDIPDPEPPLTESPDVTPTPSTPPVSPDPEPSEPPIEIPDDDTPLAPSPDVTPDDDITEIDDEEVPLADVPKTGDDAKIWLTLALLSAAGLGVIGLMQRRTRKNGRDS